MINKGRNVVRRGANHRGIKISHDERHIVRKLRAEGMTLVSIAKRYDVSFQTISRICLGDGSYGTT
jgi:transposase